MANFARSATLNWTGDVIRGRGSVTAGSEAFSVAVTYPRLAGEPPETTAPEELLAASHAACFGIGLRSVIGRRGGTVQGVRVTATVTAEKGASGIVIRSSHLNAEVEGLAGLDSAILPEVGDEVEQGCTISAAIRGSVAISVAVTAV